MSPKATSPRRSRNPSHGRADPPATTVPRRQPRGRIGDDRRAGAAAAIACVLRARWQRALDLDACAAAQGEGRAALRVGIAVRDGPRAALSVRGLLGPG